MEQWYANPSTEGAAPIQWSSPFPGEGAPSNAWLHEDPSATVPAAGPPHSGGAPGAVGVRGAGPSAFAGAQPGGNAGTAPGGSVQAGGAGTIPPEQFRRAPGQQEAMNDIGDPSAQQMQQIRVHQQAQMAQLQQCAPTAHSPFLWPLFLRRRCRPCYRCRPWR